MGQQQVDLLQGHPSGVQPQRPGYIFQDLRRFGGHVLGFLDDIFGLARIRDAPGTAEVRLTLLDLDPFRTG